MKILSTLILLGVLHFNTFSNDLQDIRKAFHTAVLAPSKVQGYYKYINAIEAKDDGIVMAYQAMSEALVAQETWNPIEKYNRIKKFEKLIDQAIFMDPSNLEIRFLRLCIESYIPEWLGIPNHVLDDKVFILTHLADAKLLLFDQSYIRYISCFIKETGIYSAAEIGLIEKELNLCLALSKVE